MATDATDLGFRMHAERTPNPNSIKWVLGQALVEGGVSAHFESAPEPDVSPLAARLFELDGVMGVFFASNFVTVTKRPELEWTEIAQPIVDAIKECVSGGIAAIGPGFEVAAPADDDATDGVVEVYMQGSCQGCPSSTATLKMGIEARLREEIPEVKEVVAL
jgi:Fe-S cluster biogenesis protein NfuA